MSELSRKTVCRCDRRSELSANGAGKQAGKIQLLLNWPFGNCHHPKVKPGTPSEGVCGSLGCSHSHFGLDSL